MKKAVNKILFITLSNIGDVILTLPMLDYLKDKFPAAKITVMVGPRPADIFNGNPYVQRVIVYDKHSRLRGKIRLFQELKREKFDMVIDLRNSFFGFFLPAQYRLAPFLPVPYILKHMRYRNLYQMLKFSANRSYLSAFTKGKFIHFTKSDEGHINEILKQNNISTQDKIVVVSAGARSHIKRWPQDNFVVLISALIKEAGVKVILVGDKEDLPVNEYIIRHLLEPVLDLAGKTSIAQLSCLLKKAALVITNDSAVGHLASYLNIPVLGIFGPTNELKYGPWSQVYSVVTKGLFCRPCEKAQCQFGTLECMKVVKVQDVLKAAKLLLNNRRKYAQPLLDFPLKRILISRTDRLGDVLLSTPVIKALRDAFPHAFIAMIIHPAAKDVLEHNPYLDEVIIYDKDDLHKSWRGSWRFSQNLKKKKFDLAIMLHPTNRAHLVAFFAGIRERLGYDRKLGFLLTRRIKHTKQLGQMHEVEYNLDLLKHLGISPLEKKLFMPIRAESEMWLDALFRREGIKVNDKLLAIHPGASCPSKIWPNSRFAEAADKLAEKYGFKILVVAGPGDLKLANEVTKHMRHPALNLAGRTSVSQLASVLKRCQLFISNDSGPVHIATAVGTPVISIFGRAQKGLSPKRWGPLGERDRVLHKDVGCIECLAHNCVKEFACLKAITVDDVVRMAEEILQ